MGYAVYARALWVEGGGGDFDKQRDLLGDISEGVWDDEENHGDGCAA